VRKHQAPRKESLLKWKRLVGLITVKDVVVEVVEARLEGLTAITLT
jgi:hypothetical protein